MHSSLFLSSAVTCLTLAVTVAGRPALDVLETRDELIDRADNSLGSTCDLDLSDPNAAWAKSKAPSFLDSLMYSRGSGKMGSIAGLDKRVDKMATGQSTSNMDCTDFGNTASCPLPSAKDCKDTSKFASPVWYWIQVAFHNFNGYYSAMHDAAGWQAVQNSLDIAGLAGDVTGGWNTDPVDSSTLYNHVAAGLGVAGAVLGAIPDVGPILGTMVAVMSGMTSAKEKQAAIDHANEQQNAANLRADAVKELSARVQNVMSSTQQSFIDVSNWMFATGADWPNQSPPTPPADDDEMYLSSQMFGKGAFLNPVSSDSIQKIQNEMVANMRQSLFGLALKANDCWATWGTLQSDGKVKSEEENVNDMCGLGWSDGAGNCWTIMAYPPAPNKPTFMKNLNVDEKGGDGLFKKYGVKPWQFFSNTLDCATNPTGDGQVDTSTMGPWPDSQGNMPKCFFSLGVTQYGNNPAGRDLPPDGAATKGPSEKCSGCS